MLPWLECRGALRGWWEMRLKDQTGKALSAELRFYPQGNGQPQQVIYRRDGVRSDF